MRILHLISSSGFFGAENVALNLMNSLKEDKNNPRLLCLKNSGKPDPEIHLQAESQGISTDVISCNKRFDMGSIKKIKDYVKKENIVLIHTHGYKSNLYGMVASRLAGIPVVTTLHGWIGEDYKARFYELVDKLVVKRMDHVVSVSPVISKELGSLKVNEDKVSFIPNGIDTERFSPASDGPDMRAIFGAKDALIIGTVGRLGPEKGHLYLMEAFKEISALVPEARLLIVGGGFLEEVLAGKAWELGIEDKVKLVGNQADMAAAYKSMDIFVLPSLIEGLPLVLLEAMSMELPVIASDVGGIPHVIGKGEGIIVPPKGIYELRYAIFGLVKDAELRRNMGKKARERIVKDFSLRSFYKKYTDTYKKVLS